MREPNTDESYEKNQNAWYTEGFLRHNSLALWPLAATYSIALGRTPCSVLHPVGLWQLFPGVISGTAD